MKLFLDTGDVEEVRRASEWGVIDGVTTNPTLIAKSGKGFRETVLKICDLVPGGDISAEVVATDYDSMLKEATEISSWHPQIVVKVPLIEPGIRLVRTLTERNIRTNVTLVFSVSQALLAAKVGATYISNFVGRVDDISDDGMRSLIRLKWLSATASKARFWRRAFGIRCTWSPPFNRVRTWAPCR
jgi:transaldolase